MQRASDRHECALARVHESMGAEWISSDGRNTCLHFLRRIFASIYFSQVQRSLAADACLLYSRCGFMDEEGVIYSILWQRLSLRLYKVTGHLQHHAIFALPDIQTNGRCYPQDVQRSSEHDEQHRGGPGNGMYLGALRFKLSTLESGHAAEGIFRWIPATRTMRLQGTRPEVPAFRRQSMNTYSKTVLIHGPNSTATGGC
jgi:hypothetical protein